METGLPPGWSLRWSQTKKAPYFLNQATRESTWEAPYGNDESKLKAYLAQYEKNGGKPVVAADGKVRASHLLIKNETSRRPKSWKSEQITRSRDESIAILKQLQKKILDGQTSFAELAQTESDCLSHEKGGDLGFFGRGQMQPQFEEATYALNVGEFSDIIESDSGVHLIQRTG